MELLLLSIIGLAVGSFLNVLIYRLNTTDKVPKFWQGRSLCPKCKHHLSWADNIPLLSFLLLSGKCRYCRKKISRQYPLVELVTAGIFLLVGFNPLLLVLASAFIVIFFSDWIYGLIPDEAVVVGIAASAISYWGDPPDLKVAVVTGIISALAFLLVVLVTRFRGMGLGDMKLAFLMGLLLSWPKSLVAFWSAFILGGVVAMTLLLLKKTRFSDTIALGPYLVLGVLIAALWSDHLLALVGL